jgi:two-component system, sensor histidine kinase and response regulator
MGDPGESEPQLVGLDEAPITEALCRPSRPLDPTAEADEPVFLGNASATSKDRRRALIAGALLLAAFAATAPWADRPLRAVPAFAVAYDAAVIVLDSITALLLFAQYRQLREWSFLALACGYLFTPLLVAAHCLGFPGAFGPGSLIGGSQTSAWLWMGWHGLFPAFIAAYAALARRERRGDVRPGTSDGRPAAAVAVSGTVAVAAAVVLLATLGKSFLPELMVGDHYRSMSTQLICSLCWTAHLVALGLLAWSTRLRRRIDVWIAVTLVALLIDVALSAVLATGRNKFGWYLGRVYGLFGVGFVLAVLLRETVELYGGAVRMAARLRESERGLRTLTEALPQLVWTSRPDGDCDYLSRQWVQYTGVAEDEQLGHRWVEVLHPDDRDRTMASWRDAVEGRAPYDLEYRIRGADGRYRWYQTRGLPLRDESGRAVKWFGTCTDIDDQKRAAEALRQAKEVAEAANRAKDEFLAHVSHEIRTPMNAILGMTELVLDTPLTDDQRQCLRMANSAAQNQLGIINDLLDFSKIEAGKLELDPADFSLRAAVGDTLRALAVRAHKKGLELIYDVQPEVPDALVGDAWRLRQVLLNLVGNAIKFTDAGEVVVRAEVAGDPAPEGEIGLRFTVRDTGIGIPPDQQERIFRAFEQEDTSITRKYGGTGLGLTIAARLVALMGGQIAVEGARGRGSTFAFTARFGRQPPGSEPLAARPPARLHDLRVLIVDDNATNRRILEEWLRSWRMEPAAVGDGLAALSELWHAVGVGRPFALVLLDARMPDMDGLALAAQIRQGAELATTRIILLTSGDRARDVARSRDLRLDAHLLKPVQQDELLEAIYRVMSRADGEATADPPAPAGGSTPAPATARLRILVADDNEFNVQHLERLLARQGHDVRLADDGRAALALLGIDGHGSGVSQSPTPGPSPLAPATEHGPLTPTFDLLLLDLQMPELDGFQVVRAIREHERATGGHLPVIALTAWSRPEDRRRCLTAGMDEYLAKPIRSADLFAAIERLVSSPSVPPSIRPDAGDGTDLLDPAVLLAVCGDAAEGLGQICESLRSHLPGRLAEVGEALRAGDAPRLRVAAHKLCGLLSAFSTVAGGVASNLEDQAAGGRLDEGRALVEQLEAMARELIERVDGLSIEALRAQAGAAGDRDRTAGP